MIVFIEGKIEALMPTKALFNVGGLGYQVNIPLSTYSALADEEYTYGRLLTHQVLREDADILYGFSTQKELDMFRLLLTAPGIGPGAALSCLSHRSADELASIIGNGQSDLLRKIKGIGEKGATQIIVSLQKTFKDAAPIEEKPTANQDAISALIGLGYTKKDAEKAVALVDQSLPLNDIIRLSLSSLSK